MKVSIITPVYNAAKFLHTTANSVLSQSYQDWEWILIDDCSSDNSWEILIELSKKDTRIKIYKNESNLNAGKTRNKAIDLAGGRFIAFLDSDDLWHPEKLAIQIPFMLNNEYYFTHTSYGYLDEVGNKIKSTLHVSKKVDYLKLLKRTEISCLTAVYDAEKIGKWYMTEYSLKEDYALWLSILKSGISSYGIDKELAYYRQVTGSSTSKKYTLIWEHVSFLKNIEGLSTFKAIYYTSYWMVNGFIRYFLK